QHLWNSRGMGSIRSSTDRPGSGRACKSAGTSVNRAVLRRHLLIAAALIILQAAVLPLPPVETQAPPFTRAPVADAVLAEQRGGIRLPNGIDVDLSIDTITAIDGRIVLQTVTRITEGSPVVTAYVPEGDEIGRAHV